MDTSTDISTNSTVFKTKQEPVKESVIEPKETPGLQETNSDIPQAKDQTDRIDVWEIENKREYLQDVFGIRETAHIFPIKAQYKYIDKFLKAEMQEREWDMTKDNYHSMLSEIEDEIGTNKMERYKRIQRLFQYVKTLNKYRELKKKKESFRVF